MTLDATVGGSGSDSYVTVAAADALAAADMGPEAERWKGSLTTIPDREQALKRATRELDGYLRTGYPPVSRTQRLRFPRRDVDEDATGVAVIPRALQEATYYLAAFLLANAPVIARRDARKARGQDQYSEAGSSAAESQDDRPDWPDRVMRSIAGFRTVGGSGGRAMRSVRVSSGFVGWT